MDEFAGPFRNLVRATFVGGTRKRGRHIEQNLDVSLPFSHENLWRRKLSIAYLPSIKPGLVYVTAASIDSLNIPTWIHSNDVDLRPTFPPNPSRCLSTLVLNGKENWWTRRRRNVSKTCCVSRGETCCGWKNFRRQVGRISVRL